LVRVAVSGEVGRPQVFAVRPETTIGEAVAQAGGPNQFGKRDQVRVLRRDAGGRQQELLVDLLNPSFFRDFMLPALSVVGTVASIYLVIDRAQRND
jgi:protein involved in polysaccharide export with SLBB domain